MSEISPVGTPSYDDVAVVMITRNEEGAIEKVVADALAALPGAEVFVVDGSSDRTPELAEKAGATVVREPGGGPAPALLAALRVSARAIVVTVDADDTYPAEAYPVLVDLVRGGADVAGGDRLGHGRPGAMPLPNWLANLTFSLLASVRARKRLRDVHSGQRAYRRSMIDEFAWDATGLAFPVDLLLWPAYAHRKVVEIAIPYRERVGDTKLTPLDDGKHTLRRIFRPLRDRVR